MGGQAPLDSCYSVMTIELNHWILLSLKHTHAERTTPTYSPVLLCSSYVCITVIKLFKMLMYVLNSWPRQGPPNQQRSIVLIENKLKWSVRRNSSPLSDRRLCVSLTNTMPQKNNGRWLRPLLVTTNKSFSANTDRRPSFSQFRDEGHLLLSGLLIDPNWCCDRQRG